MNAEDRFAPDQERAAFLALMLARPDGLSWERLLLDVIDTGSARSVWHRLVPADLLEASALLDAFEPLHT